MATKPNKTERRWRRIVDEWRQSGLSAPAFGKRRGISAGMIYAWSSRLSKQDAWAAESSDPVTTPQFLPVEVVAQTTPAQDDRQRVLTIVLPRGEVIHVPPEVDLSHLSRVVAALHGGRTT